MTFSRKIILKLDMKRTDYKEMIRKLDCIKIKNSSLSKKNIKNIR